MASVVLKLLLLLVLMELVQTLVHWLKGCVRFVLASK